MQVQTAWYDCARAYLAGVPHFRVCVKSASRFLNLLLDLVNNLVMNDIFILFLFVCKEG